MFLIVYLIIFFLFNEKNLIEKQKIEKNKKEVLYIKRKENKKKYFFTIQSKKIAQDFINKLNNAYLLTIARSDRF